jgi:uncharacterized membrane protein
MTDPIFLIVMAFFGLLGLLMAINPQQYLVWLKAARPTLGIRENDPNALAVARFIGVCFVLFPVSVFVAVIFEHYWK